jgi:uncharacterized membrane protein
VKADKLKRRIKYLFVVLILLYPILVFSALVIFKLPIRFLSIFIIALALAYFLVNRHTYKGRNAVAVFVSPAILCCIGVVCFFTGSSLTLKLYPVLANFVYFVIMITSVFIPPPVVLYIINAFDKKLRDNLEPAAFERCCRRATIAWCVFFFFDSIIALVTVFRAPAIVWGIYNGGITYVLMGMVFAGEYFIFKKMERRSLAERRNVGEGGEAGVYS